MDNLTLLRIIATINPTMTFGELLEGLKRC
jgi:hypothetical protein|nr:MAG TPA: Phenol hydroxylase conserved region [Caudoviricetes sp.]